MIEDVVEIEVHQEEVVLADLVWGKVVINDLVVHLVWEEVPWAVKDQGLIMVQMDLAKMTDHNHLAVGVVEAVLDSLQHMANIINLTMVVAVVQEAVIQIMETVISTKVQVDMAVEDINLEVTEFRTVSQEGTAVEVVLQMMAILARMVVEV